MYPMPSPMGFYGIQNSPRKVSLSAVTLKLFSGPKDPK